MTVTMTLAMALTMTMTLAVTVTMTLAVTVTMTMTLAVTLTMALPNILLSGLSFQLTERFYRLPSNVPDLVRKGLNVFPIGLSEFARIIDNAGPLQTETEIVYAFENARVDVTAAIECDFLAQHLFDSSAF
jgi:hypothetical protein